MTEHKDGWPTEFHLFPHLERVAKFIGNIFMMHQLSSHGDHFVENRGGGPALDRALYDADLSGAGYWPEGEDGIQP